MGTSTLLAMSVEEGAAAGNDDDDGLRVLYPAEFDLTYTIVVAGNCRE